MMKNDYRRALILLRSALSGVNGHVRLERRTLMGSMQFTVSGLKTDLPLQAAMAAKTDSGWKIAHIGTLGRDTRGQAGLNWTFDPRSIEGLPLEKYSVLLVLETGAQTCRAILTGYVNGSRQVDWERVEQAACAGYIELQPSGGAEESAEENTAQTADGDMHNGGDQYVSEAETGTPVPETTAVLTETDACSCPAADPDAPLPGTTPIFAQEDACDRPAADPDVPLPGTAPIFVQEDACDRPAADAPCMAAVFSETDACDRSAEPGVNTGAMARFAPDEDLDVPAAGEKNLLAEDIGNAAVETAGGGVLFYSDPLDVPARAARTALEALGLDAQTGWPDGIEPLREAFAASEPVFLSAQPDHVFVMAAHSADCPACAVGLRAEEGMPVSVAYAIPGEFSETPPNGLEGYLWREGWWIAVADAKTGSYLHI